MSPAIDRRGAAQANQRAAAFIRFQILGDHSAMDFTLNEASQTPEEHLAFIVALASIASSLAISKFGQDTALEYLHAVASASALVAGSDNIDKYFDDIAGD